MLKVSRNSLPAWANFRALVLPVFVSLICVSPIYSQSIGGLRAPEKPAKAEVPLALRAARGQAPVRKLNDNLRPSSSALKRLRPLQPHEQIDDLSMKVVRLGVVRSLPKPINPIAESTRFQLGEGELAVSGIISEGALYTRLRFSKMSLPAGARVFVYSLNDPNEFYGPFEGNGPAGDGMFWTPPVKGDAVAIEYFTPHSVSRVNDVPFIIQEVSHIYRDPLKVMADNIAGSCNLEVTSDWADVAKSAGYLEFVDGGAELACSGTLLNNQTNDQTPFVLTANHCFSTQSAAQSLRVYWNYNSGESPPPGTPFTDGSTLLATGSASDYTFVRLTGSLPGGLYFAGWDASPTGTGTGVTGIHHPQTSHKRISFGTTNSTCGGGLPGPCSNFIHVGWNAGTTEVGSSGSGLWRGSSFDPLLVGQLTGGAASCSNPTGVDHYGRFSVTYPNISSFLSTGGGGGGADLSITKTTAHDRIAPGGQVVYLLTVTNGSGSTAQGVTITDNLPSQLSFVSCTPISGGCFGSGNNRTIDFGTVAANTSKTAILVASVNGSVPNGTIISNTATVTSSTSDSNSANNSSTATATVTTSPFVSRSNGKIAYGSDRAGSGSPSGFYTINSNGSGDSILFSLEPFGSPPAWSPDGTKIAYGRRNAGTFDSEIFVANADGTGSVKVAGNVYNLNGRIAWSPNGAKLAFVGTSNFTFVVNSDGTGLMQLPNVPASANDLAWSPDGSKFAYSDGANVLVMGIDGTNRTNLTQGLVSIQGEQARSVAPRWSPDGSKLLFSAESNNYKNVFVMNANGSGLAPLITLHQSAQPAWSPDGTKITFVGLNSIYVANSNGTGATPLPSGGTYNFKPDWQATAGAPPLLQFSSNNYNISEAGGRIPITVTRSTSVGAATVDYATSDSAGLTPCNTFLTYASSRCDYATTIGTLRFSSGETSKTIYIPIVDDAYQDSVETFTLTLSNPTGGTLGTSVTTITIQDDAQPTSNPISSNAFFVRQHYIDFLGREPEPQGLQDWQNILANCGTTVAQPCDRIEVSSAFFRSTEFQSRGYYIYRFYSSVGRIPLSGEFMPDLAKVSGFLSDAELEANKSAFVTEFMNRAEFQNKYSPTFGNPSAYVDALLQTVGLPAHPSRQSWINTLNSNNNSQTRGQVLRELVESQSVYDKYYNEAFVIMQYFGYLRRTADASYQSWIQTMNQNGGDYRTMINGFLNSTEYRQRFGP